MLNAENITHLCSEWGSGPVGKKAACDPIIKDCSWNIATKQENAFHGATLMLAFSDLKISFCNLNIFSVSYS